MNIDEIEKLDDNKIKELLRKHIENITRPAFGVLPQRELDLLHFQLLRESNVIKSDASLYSLMSSLKITRAKARNLLFDLEIRQSQEENDLDQLARTALANPRGFVMDGAYLAFGIENPVVQAHIKDKVSMLGHLTDASFDSAIIKIKPAAMGPLVKSLMDEDDQKLFKEAMIEAGFDKDENITVAIKEGLKHLATKAVGKTATTIGAGYIDQLADFLTPHARNAKDRLVKALRETYDVLYSKDQAEPRIR